MDWLRPNVSVWHLKTCNSKTPSANQVKAVASFRDVRL
jgi:hypothetical protein